MGDVNMRKLSAATLFALATLAVAEPALAVVTVWNGTGSNGTINWGQLGPETTVVPSGSGVSSTNGVNATVTDSYQNMQVLQEGSTWFGNFAPGDFLLYSNIADDPFHDETMTITFATAVQAAGAQITSNFYGPFVARILTNDGSFFDIPGVMDGNEDNSAPFLGAISDSANITGITFSMQVNGGAGFAINDLRLLAGAGAVPEPSTWAMILLGFGAIGASTRRRKTASRALDLS
jgi:hypothetical protein